MTLLYSDDVFLRHDTGSHPECAERLLRTRARLAQLGLDARCTRPAVQPASPQRVARIHRLDYIEALKKYCAQGGGLIEQDTVTSRDSYQAALCAAGAVCDAVERVVSGQDTQALCLVRPPGHHALGTGAMGFCLFNNVAIAARLATDELSVDRVLIVDWDVHHGNGTQASFYDEERIGFLSIHRWPFYPGTGSADETGTAQGLGSTLNLPVRFGTPRQEYHRRLADGLEQLAARVRPNLVLISAGFDAHRADPVGSLGLESEDFATLTRLVRQVAAVHAGGRLVSVLEGGYNLDALAECVEVHLQELLAAESQAH